jgi:membrane protein YdbS with pleckstrin-like domain
MSNELMPGEALVMKEHQHWVVMIKPLLLPIALVILVGLLDVFQTIPSDYRILATLAAVALLGVWLIVVWIRWNSRSFTITDRRVILDTGVFSRASKVIALDRVQDIDSAGAAGAEVLSALPRPQRFRDEVFSRAEKLRTVGSGGESPAAAPPSV